MDYSRRMGDPIKSAEVKEDNVYIETLHGELWRIWFPEPFGPPHMERLERC